MTTVAWDCKTLASDSLLSTSGGVKDLGKYPKVCIPEEGEKWTIHGLDVIAFGWSGDVTGANLVKAKLTEGLNLVTKAIPLAEVVRVDAIIITADAVFTWILGTNDADAVISNIYPQDGPYAIGSGGKYAVGVMSIGGDAIMGVKAGINVDAYSGGDIYVWKKDEPKTIKSFNHLELV